MVKKAYHPIEKAQNKKIDRAIKDLRSAKKAIGKPVTRKTLLKGALQDIKNVLNIEYE